MKEKPTLKQSLFSAAAVIVAIIVYAYGFTVTKVDFGEARSPDRQKSLTRVLRALAHPDLFEVDYEETTLETPFYLPCPEGGVETPQPDTSGAYITTNVNCASGGDTIVVNGYGLQPRSSGPINILTYSAEEDQTIPRPIGNFYVDDKGNFSVEVTLPDRQAVGRSTPIQAIGKERLGIVGFSTEAKITFDKIIETVFLALLATTFGTLISVPLSFFAARNLMTEVRSPLSRIALSLIGWILGFAVGAFAYKYIGGWIAPLQSNGLIELLLAAVGLAGAFFIVRQQLTQEVKSTSWITSILHTLYNIAAILLVVAALDFLASLLKSVGDNLSAALGWFGFFGHFIYILGDMADMLVPALCAVLIGAVVGGLLGNFGQTISDKLDARVGRIINLIVTPISFGLTAVVIMHGVNWFYSFEDPRIYNLYPALIGGLIGLLLAIRYRADQTLPTGTVIYTIARTAMNGTRSVEPLIWAIVFVVWIGLGPFAGSLALTLHTIASLTKLYSEQVESILPGPLEAIQATGANRLQNIIFAVVPQIIPPYISFTMYRWDINVRMSTIIGFVGGGGIGFILQQNINLLKYRAAATNILAIAIVVSAMDFISSSLRKRFV